MGKYEKSLFVAGVTEAQLTAVLDELNEVPEFDGDDVWAQGEAYGSTVFAEYPVKVLSWGDEQLVKAYLDRTTTILREQFADARLMTDDEFNWYAMADEFSRQVREQRAGAVTEMATKDDVEVTLLARLPASEEQHVQTVLDQVAAASPWSWDTEYTVDGDTNHGYGKGFEIHMLLDLVDPHPATVGELKGIILALCGVLTKELGAPVIDFYDLDEFR
ncbi:hypothetical protein [Tsukamurella pseudospumae]|uniref:hypothetical protein n=1 Tax=Tsukamurella pseudospumae TaxID=239498 RepID=UPI00111230ED|nr:hypothetical protein [Tsukamurella pseudospumae]